MQGALFQQAEITQIQSQASELVPGHGTGVQAQAVNDDVYHNEKSPLRMLLSVLGNVIGGALMLSAMFVFPHLVAGFLS